MKHLIVIALALVAACGKEEPAANTPSLTVPKTSTTDTSKAALDKAIADTKALIAKKEADVKALFEKVKSDPMKAATYQAEADKLQKEIADLQAKLDEYTKEAEAK